MPCRYKHYQHTMKKSILSSLLLSVLVGFSSCIKDSEMHQLSIVSPGKILFADAAMDSLNFFTFDSWKVQPNCDWLHVDGSPSATFTNTGQLYAFKVIFAIDPNTTGHTRVGIATVTSHGYSASGIFAQMGCLDVRLPRYTVGVGLPGTSTDSVFYAMANEADTEKDTIAFQVRQPWTLQYVNEQDAEWLTLESTAGVRGFSKVPVVMKKNTDTENVRKAHLVLTSGGIKTDIIVRQEKSLKAAETQP